MNTFVVHVENVPGVLTRVASLVRRRGFNIESLTVGHTDTPDVSRMTIVIDTDDLGADGGCQRTYRHSHVVPPGRHSRCE